MQLNVCFLLILISKIKTFICYEVFLFPIFGILAGLYISCPCLLIPENWKCFNYIIAKSAEDKIPLKVALEISPSYLLKGKNKNKASKIRIVADACFR